MNILQSSKICRAQNNCLFQINKFSKWKILKKKVTHDSKLNTVPGKKFFFPPLLKRTLGYSEKF